MPFRFPNNSHRVSINGATGSGKTRFGVWLLSHYDFTKHPFVMIDFKGDDLIEQIGWAKEISLTDTPKHAGLYVVRPNPDQQEEIDKFLWRIWERGNCGLFLDEGYMIDKGSPAFNALLTQGRSKRVPIITLTQRPVACSRFVFSEASFFAVFRLQDKRDYDIVRGFTPNNSVFDFTNPLPNYNCRWYDVGQDYSTFIQPVPDDAEILVRFEDKLKTKLRRI